MLDDTDKLYAQTVEKMHYNGLEKFNDFDGKEELSKIYHGYGDAQMRYNRRMSIVFAGLFGVCALLSEELPNYVAKPIAGTGAVVAVVGAAGAVSARKRMRQNETSIANIARYVDSIVEMRQKINLPILGGDMIVSSPGTGSVQYG